jgi:hypothetical protein
VPSNVDTYLYNTTRTDCGVGWGNFECVNSSPLDCYSSTNPPVTFDDAVAWPTSGADSCSCSGYTQTDACEDSSFSTQVN